MGNDTTYCIYRIVCFVTGACYIGQTKNFRQRRNGHLSTLKCRTHGNEYLQRAYDKYGKNAFYFEVLEANISQECVNDRETYWIEISQQTNELYNIIPGGGINPAYLRGKKTVWNGVEYPTLNDATKASGYGVVTMIRYIKSGYTRDDDIPHPLNCTPINWNGIQYRSINTAAKSIGVKWDTMQRYIKLGYVCDDDIVNTHRKPCIWDSVEYVSVTAAARANNVSVGAMSIWLKKQQRTP